MQLADLNSTNSAASYIAQIAPKAELSAAFSDGDGADVTGQLLAVGWPDGLAALTADPFADPPSFTRNPIHGLAFTNFYQLLVMF